MINIRNRGTMVVTNQVRVRKLRGKILHVYGGGRLSAVNLEIESINMTIDALATVKATLKGATFHYAGIYSNNPRSCRFVCIEFV